MIKRLLPILLLAMPCWAGDQPIEVDSNNGKVKRTISGVGRPTKPIDFSPVTVTGLTVSGSTAWGAITGMLSDQTDLQTALDAKQPLDTQLTSLAGLSYAGNGTKMVRVNAGETDFELATASASVAWGGITGTLSDQTDLQTALDGKVDENAGITGATKTKITYDAKGLVTAGADATTADIADSLNKRYVTDANLTVIGNTSGTNTGDQDLSGYVPTTRTVNGHALSSNVTVTASDIADVSDTAFASSWDTVTTTAPSKNAVYDWAHIFDTDDDGKVNVLDLTAGLVKTDAGGVVSTTTDNTSNWDTAYTDRLKWDGGATGLTAATGRTSLGGTTVGQNIFLLTNPGAITFLKMAADNTVSAESASTHRTSLGATTVGGNVFTLTNPSAISFIKIAADNTVSTRTPSEVLSDIGAQAAGSYLTSANIDDTAFASSWNGVTTIAPTKNAVYDWGHTFDTDDDGKVNVVDTGAGILKSDSSGVVSAATAGTDYGTVASTTNVLKGNNDGTAVASVIQTGANTYTMVINQNAKTEFKVNNVTNGTDSFTELTASSNTAGVSIGGTAALFTPSGLYQGSDAFLSAGAGSRFLINSSSIPIQFSTDGNTTEIFRFNYNTIASATSATLDTINIPATTDTVTGTTQITTAKGFNHFSIYKPTYTDSSAVTIDRGATLYIEDAPTAGGSVTLSAKYPLWVDNGAVRFDGGLTVGGTAAPSTGVINASTGFTISGSAAAGAKLQGDGTNFVSQAPVETDGTNSNPTGTNNTTGLMMGLNKTITPKGSGKVLVIITGQATNNTGDDGFKYDIRYGTGSAPTNGAALTGTQVGSTISGSCVASSTTTAVPIMPFADAGLVTGLTVNTAYWFDMSLAAVTGGTATVTSVNVVLLEI